MYDGQQIAVPSSYNVNPQTGSKQERCIWRRGKMMHNQEKGNLHTSTGVLKCSRDVPEQWHMRKQMSATF